MTIDFKFLIILIALFLSISLVSASDDINSDSFKQINDTSDIPISDNETGVALESESSEIEKTTPIFSLSAKSVKCKDTLEIYLKNLTGSPLKNKIIKATINKKTYNLKTNSKGTAKLKINLPSKKYKLTLSYNGDTIFNPVTKQFTLKVSKLKTKLTESANFVASGNYLYFQLTDSRGDAVKGMKIKIKNAKNTIKKTDSKGKIRLKLSSSKLITAKFPGDKQYRGCFKKLYVHTISSMSINIANSKLIIEGFLRIYLKINGKAVSKKLGLSIGGKKFFKKTNSEGIAVINPNLKAKSYTVKAKVGKYYAAKNIRCFEGNVKDPLKDNISFKNGKVDIDVMPADYVMGDENAKYSLKKSQYREVLKRDSYCLFLNGKLTKYTFFKTKSHPKLNHIIKREKWNVIERAINEKLVKKNKKGYWPGIITVSLKGKFYKYPYVRDVQSNGRNCGPTSCSMCSQVLRNYVCEGYLAKLSKTKSWGTSCRNMVKALKKNNMLGLYFYKSSFSHALNELKNNGAALVFHANNHYVSILDISKNGKMLLVSNSYGSYGNIESKWLKVSFMKNKFSKKWDESLIVKLDYKLSISAKNSINCYYNSMGRNWVAQNTHYTFGKI